MAMKNKGKCSLDGAGPRKKGKFNGDCSTLPPVFISEGLQEENVITKIRKAWQSENDEASLADKFHVYKEPFTCCTVQNFTSNPDFLTPFIDELNDLIFKAKHNDLYKFSQSDDLKSTRTPYIESFKRFAADKMKTWMSQATGIELNDSVDLFCARYDYTDHLLCHDDELEGRRIAFIMYFVPEWRLEDGGSLDLFDRDEHGQPRNVVRSLVPSMNTLAFFEVTPISFHQVAEVLTRDKTRLSVGGWFHGKSVDRPPRYIEPKLPLLSPMEIDEDAFFGWINPVYLDPGTQAEIQESFESNSEISLQSFLSPEKYDAVSAALKDKCITWSTKGPANKRHYEAAESFPEIVQQCVDFLRSDAFFLLLSNLTGLRLHELAPNDDSDDEKSEKKEETTEEPDGGNCSKSNGRTSPKEEEERPAPDPKCRSEVRRWTHGSYTLIHDDDSEQKEFALDARLFFNCSEWAIEQGGYTSYVAKDEDEELLTAQPEENALVLVYRDAETLRFVKRVNDNVNELTQKEFHDIAVVYYE